MKNKLKQHKDQGEVLHGWSEPKIYSLYLLVFF